MRICRNKLRSVLNASLLSLFANCLSFVTSSQQIVNYTRILRSNFGTETMWDGNSFNVYGLTPALVDSPKIPADIIWCNEGDSVVINALSVSQLHHHTIHLHGLDVNTRNDGDPATSFYLSHMQDTTYSFKANHAGTYLYHCHVGDVVHVQMGMYGLIIVRAAGGANTAWTGGPAFNQQKAWLFSEIDEAWHDNPPQHDSTNAFIELPPYEPDYFLINGLAQQELEDSTTKIVGAVNEKIYLRTAGIGFFNTRIIFPSSLQSEIIDSDGRPLPQAIQSDTLEVMPGERYGVMLIPSQEFEGTIEVQYINMNTDSVWHSEYVPVSIQGTYQVKELLQPIVEVFPNPVNDVLNLKNDSHELVRYNLYNQNGQLIFSEYNSKVLQEFDCSGLSSGVYCLTASTKNYTTRKQILKL